MNHDLRKMIVRAEGRYLTDAEVAQVRDYAMNMPARIEAARRLEEREGQILERAAAAFLGNHADYAKRVPDAVEKTKRDMALTLRYLAAAHIRSDMDFFRRNYAEWISELLRSIVACEVLVSGQKCLRDALEEGLDPVDARSFVRYLDVFIEALGAEDAWS